jgi:hypothetical protein
VGTILQLNNGFVAVYTVIYYWFISTNWIPINIFGAVLTVVSAVGVYFLPESPKFYLSTRRYDEAREAINFIAKTNGKREFTAKFDREVIDEKQAIIRDQELNASKISTVGPDQYLKKTSEEDEANNKQPLIAKQ